MPGHTSKKVCYDLISEKIIQRIITEFFILLTLLICTHIVSESMHSKYFYYSNIQTENTFVKNIPYIRKFHYEAFSFEDIITADIMINFIWNNFLSIIHDNKYLSEDDRNDTAKPYLLNVGLIVGVPRLRQLRVQQMDYCFHEIAFQKKECFYEYSTSNEFKGNYKGVEYKADAKPIWTNFYKYSGGGFSLLMDLNYSFNMDLLDHIYTSRWVDSATRLVVLEFSVFHDATEMFQIIKFIFEIMPTGLVTPSTYIRCIPVKCFILMNTHIIVVGVIFYFIVFYYTYQEIYEFFLCRSKISYIKAVSNYPDIVFLIASYVVLGYNVWHTLEINNIYEAYNINSDTFINLDSLINGWDVYCVFMGIVTFTVWLKFIRFISFHRTLKRLAATIKLSFNNILGFFFIFICTLYAFAQLGTILFGDKIEQFHSNYVSIITVMRILMSDVDYMPMHKVQPVLAPIYFVAVIVSIYGISLNLFVAIYLSTYSDVKATVIVRDRLVFKMIVQVVKQYFCFWRRRRLSEDAEVFVVELVKEEPKEEGSDGKKPPTTTEPMLNLREELARFTERSIKIEAMLESFVITIENITQLQDLKATQNELN